MAASVQLKGSAQANALAMIGGEYDCGGGDGGDGG